eukprot:5450105-Pyramimonas_sp.AAC.1
MRRIVSSADAPETEGYRYAGRATRHLLQASGLSTEVFNMNHAAREVRKIVDELELPAMDACLRCRRALTDVSTDAGQAYE